jgi:hypothetical protein
MGGVHYSASFPPLDALCVAHVRFSGRQHELFREYVGHVTLWGPFFCYHPPSALLVYLGSL